MPTLISHLAVPLALRLGFRQRPLGRPLTLFLLILALLPDFDVVAFKLGIPYESIWGHRGFSHSLGFALLLGLFAFGIAPWLRAGRIRAGLLSSVTLYSHALLDAATDGGLGPALLWPLSERRIFFSLTPIEVAPLHPRHFLSERMLDVFLSEFYWVWLTSFGAALALVLVELLWLRFAGRGAPPARGGAKESLG